MGVDRRHYGVPVLTWALAAIGKVDFGDVPAWGSFVTTLGALFAAIWAGRTARRLYERESERDRRAEEDRRERAEDQRRAQAVQVCAWLGRMQYTGRWCARVQNDSRTPIHNAKVEFYFRRFGTEDEYILRGVASVNIIPPTNEPVDVFPGNGIAKVADEKDEYGKLHSEDKFADFSVAIEFTDAAGYRWRRDVRGRLTELSNQG